MHTIDFDALIRTFTFAGSRRRLARWLAAAPLGAALAAREREGAIAAHPIDRVQRRKNHRNNKNKKKRNNNNNNNNGNTNNDKGENDDTAGGFSTARVLGDAVTANWQGTNDSQEITSVAECPLSMIAAIGGGWTCDTFVGNCWIKESAQDSANERHWRVRISCGTDGSDAPFGLAENCRAVAVCLGPG